VEWTGGLGTWENSSTLNPTYTPLIDETSLVEIQLTAEAISPCDVAAVSELTLTLWDLPETQINGQDNVCRNSKEIEYWADTAGLSHNTVYNWTIEQGAIIAYSEDSARISVNWNDNATANGSIMLTTNFKNTGCTFDATAYDVEIEQTDAPEVLEIIGKPFNNPVVLICQNPDFKYQWYKDGIELNGETGQYYYNSGMEAGDYFVRVNDTSNAVCANYSESFTKSTPSKSVDFDSEFSVYPNPATNEINITLNTEKIKDTEGLTLQFFTLTGEWVQTIRIDNFLETIQTNNLKQGVYTVSLYDEWRLLSIQKLIIVN